MTIDGDELKANLERMISQRQKKLGEWQRMEMARYQSGDGFVDADAAAEFYFADRDAQYRKTIEEASAKAYMNALYEVIGLL